MTTKIHTATLREIHSQISNIETDTILLIADQHVWADYKKRLPLDTLEGKKVIFWKAPTGEKAKTYGEFESCIEFFIGKGVHRKCHLIALGGGALSDFAGFVASTLLRGIPWSIVPTTLLSMVDASIGGKVAINSREGKNLIGNFHKPENVWMCKDFLETLPENEKDSGKGELLKYAFLDKELHDQIVSSTDLNTIITTAAQYKLDLTERDFRETNERKILNLGHTFGHALERIYRLPHGIAVAWGMVLVFKLFGGEEFLETFAQLRTSLDLKKSDAPWLNREFPDGKIMELVRKDKKISHKDTIDLIVIESIGKAQIKEYSLDEVEKILEDNKNDLKQFTV
ncbi:MAG: 3-dehydroquinate synthase [Halobacteriovoraceae bacterium]|jgi:3-dehydroquinate synthase|nr:3-dehydroquinate synthase [Halobacteriovoraceae bacterium]MBT5093518.1 3-dehydroquinate synthase [Halobacteriovoraceae bacterium]